MLVEETIIILVFDHAVSGPGGLTDVDNGGGGGGCRNCDAGAVPRKRVDRHAVANLANATGTAFVSKGKACRLALN
jgi:hypothetical protein